MAQLVDKDIGNNKMNDGDMKDHKSAIAIIKKGDKILVQDHVKFNFLIPPVGKQEGDEPLFQTLRREVYEETGLQVDLAKKLFSVSNTYVRAREGEKPKNVKVNVTFFEVTKYHGKLENKEPNKHRKIYFESIENLRKIKGRMSHGIYNYLKYLDKDTKDLEDYKEY